MKVSACTTTPQAIRSYISLGSECLLHLPAERGADVVISTCNFMSWKEQLFGGGL